MYAESYKTGVVLCCGGMIPQVSPFINFGKTLNSMRVHFQTSQKEIPGLQTSIAKTIVAYGDLAIKAGGNKTFLGHLLTVDATPKAEHCEFDGKDYVSGLQLIASN